MESELNILVLSCGTRNKVVQYFKKQLNNKGKVIATDCSRLAPALYEADQYFIVPRIDEKNYLDTILSICKENDVKAVLSLIDPELTLLAENKEKFYEIGVTPIVSKLETVEMCFDKYKMYEFLLENNFPIIKSYVDKNDFFDDQKTNKIDYPVFVKPVRGSASLNINKVSTRQEIELLYKQDSNLMIQEFMNGTEYGVDAYIDMLSGEVVSIFIKEKITMRAGETDKSVSIKNDKIFELVKQFIEKLEFRGVIDIDIFEVNGEYYISEVNPRFGGGYPHAFESGVNFIGMIIKNLEGLQNSNTVAQYNEGIYMMKYNEVYIKNAFNE
ncbi:ATP-grasp domain-containing protein [Priestia aryabhattai]|uniref:ATP-grasp domain-containing protein n=1 Tax=Priestia aryabhattai TaxID=412384 RepID=UPI0021AFDAA3|nr:ATP-grasp domain-containing protein [Priestia aryabhattai]MBY0029980.1 ATP-grasp domain-containing protein [Priestia aryabhattai]